MHHRLVKVDEQVKVCHVLCILLLCALTERRRGSEAVDSPTCSRRTRTAARFFNSRPSWRASPGLGVARDALHAPILVPVATSFSATTRASCRASFRAAPARRARPSRYCRTSTKPSRGSCQPCAGSSSTNQCPACVGACTAPRLHRQHRYPSLSLWCECHHLLCDEHPSGVQSHRMGQMSPLVSISLPMSVYTPGSGNRQVQRPAPSGLCTELAGMAEQRPEHVRQRLGLIAGLVPEEHAGRPTSVPRLACNSSTSASMRSRLNAWVNFSPAGATPRYCMSGSSCTQ